MARITQRPDARTAVGDHGWLAAGSPSGPTNLASYSRTMALEEGPTRRSKQANFSNEENAKLVQWYLESYEEYYCRSCGANIKSKLENKTNTSARDII
ncbi:hypothetical protein ANCDUO_13219 [Ancylostoma duodenale]|uniref:Uncharacterized protein n=1 Tax=Ancylostoma duodenale TaxID=51022 RepID=A0A0C2D3G6_9BILA|nr:hypothetical protein ANCDUO_13219 [Ancylostoma duodenale]